MLAVAAWLLFVDDIRSQHFKWNSPYCSSIYNPTMEVSIHPLKTGFKVFRHNRLMHITLSNKKGDHVNYLQSPSVFLEIELPLRCLADELIEGVNPFELSCKWLR